MQHIGTCWRYYIIFAMITSSSVTRHSELIHGFQFDQVGTRHIPEISASDFIFLICCITLHAALEYRKLHKK